jgi:succinoglycan biosynthesis transport protein ExoP
MALEQYWQVVKKWWWLMVASTLVAALSSYISVSRQPRIYQAATTVMIGQSVRKANPTYDDFYISEQLAQTYVSMIQRRPILQGAAETLGLSYVPWSENVSARLVPGTQLVEIAVRDTSPERARALADEIANQLILQSPTESGQDQSRVAFVREQLQSLEENIQATEEEIETEEAKLDAANSARAIQQIEDNLWALDEKLASYQYTYASLLQTEQGGTNYISVIEPATTPTYPISPRVMETVALAAAIGLGLAVGGALLIEFLDDTLKTPDDVQRAVDLPTLGAIARMDGDGYEGKLVAVEHPRSPTAEAFRALRVNIQFCALDRPLRTLVVTSANPIEGKSTIVANLAVVMAQAGNSVIVVDADLRRPSQHKIFGLDNLYGLSNAILEPDPELSAFSQSLERDSLSRLFSAGDGQRSMEHARAAGVGDVHVVTSGPLPPNPADLLGSERMRVLLGELEGQADIVLFDTPPVLAVTDAVVLATRVDGVLLLNDAMRTRRSMTRRAVERLRQVDANLLGVVLNRVPASGGGGYYTYQYYYAEEERESTKRRRQKQSWQGAPRLSFLGKLKWPGNHRGSNGSQPADDSVSVERRQVDEGHQEQMEARDARSGAR